jgi:hypothetical protein
VDTALYISTPNNYLSYRGQPATAPDPPGPTLQKAEAILASFMQKMNLDQLSPLKTISYGYYTLKGGEPEPAKPTQAEVIKIEQAYDLDNIPAPLNPQNLTALTAFISQREVIRLNLSLLQAERLQSIAIINPEAAQQKLLAGEGVLVDADSNESAYGASEIDFSQTTIVAAGLIYLQDDTTKLLHPYYLFSGQARNRVYSKDMTVKYLVAAQP